MVVSPQNPSSLPSSNSIAVNSSSPLDMRLASLVAVASTFVSFTTASSMSGCGTDAGSPEHIVQIQDQIMAFVQGHPEFANRTLSPNAPFTVPVT